ncbi:unnamed protein product [Moneuplotes crassus]|uniref:B box-type domain-containing protein n=1 Tax=Euplotes crassus TaxID=5936 RepID=A0AAD1U4R3_EUPCR|nr:unnamed protein product [Moneuplotes crassus]
MEDKSKISKNPQKDDHQAPQTSAPKTPQTSLPTPSTDPSSPSKSPPDPLCPLHSKPIEAFCEEDHSLVCITCILSPIHKGKTFSSLQDATKSQTAHIKTQYQKSLQILTSLHKQKKEATQKYTGLLETCSTKKDEIIDYFNSLREIIDIKEQKLLKEVSEKEQVVSEQFGKKMKAMEEQEQRLEEMKGLVEDGEDSIKSQIDFLNECEGRNEIIEKANKPINAIKYPQPPTRFRDDRETESIIKEFKQRKKPAKKRTPAPNKNASQTPSVNKNKPKDPPKNFSQSMKVPKKVSPEKSSVTKSPQIQKNPSINNKRKSEVITTKKAQNESKPSVKPSKNLIEARRDPPKVIKEALQRQCKSINEELNITDDLNEREEEELLQNNQRNLHKFLSSREKDSQPLPPKELSKNERPKPERPPRRNMHSESLSQKKARVPSASRKMWDRKPRNQDRTKMAAERPPSGNVKDTHSSYKKRRAVKEVHDQEQGENRVQEEPVNIDRLSDLRNRRKAQKQGNNDHLSEEFKNQMSELNQVTSDILSRETFMPNSLQENEFCNQDVKNLDEEKPPQMMSLSDWGLKEILQESEDQEKLKIPINSASKQACEKVKSGRRPHAPLKIKKKDIKMHK